MIVYQITNKVNDKSYIGVTTQSLRQRMNEHFARLDRKSGQENKFTAAKKKYGRDNFDVKVIAECKSKTELENKEIELIEKLKPEYNIAPGGNVGAKGYKWTDEARKKMSEQRKGRTAWNKGIPNTPEQKRKISESLKVNNPMFKLEHRITLSKRKMGKNHHNYKHGNCIGQSKYHNLDGSLKERVTS